MLLPHLDLVKEASNEKAKALLGWQPGSNEEAVVATGKSLIHLNLVK